MPAIVRGRVESDKVSWYSKRVVPANVTVAGASWKASSAVRVDKSSETVIVSPFLAMSDPDRGAVEFETPGYHRAVVTWAVAREAKLRAKSLRDMVKRVKR